MNEKFHPSEKNTETEQQDKKVEQELSPEQIERIMEKVIDIYEYGTAYVSLPRGGKNGIGGTFPNTMKKVLQEGLLGIPVENFDKKNAKSDLKKEWLANIKKVRSGEVHFNIVGRTLAIENINASGRINEFKDSEPGKAGKPFPRLKALSDYYGYPMIVFDISRFKELEPVLGSDQFFREMSIPQKSGTFRIRTYEEGSVDQVPDEYGNIGIAPEYGFLLSFRVAPRNFKGFVVYHEDDKDSLVTIMKQACKDNPEKMLPIYLQTKIPSHHESHVYYPIYNAESDMEEYERYTKEIGSFELVWPKKMSDNEVRQLVKDRRVRKQKIEP